MKATRVSVKKALGQCSWCGKRIRANSPAYVVGARKRPGVDLTEYEGIGILFSLETVPKELICLVATSDSSAKAEGKDVIFVLCSEECAEQLKATMDTEIALGGAPFGNG